MIGLPAAGKTTWVEKHVADNPDKQYNVISTTTMINKMTVNGEPRKKHHTGKWELVVQKATRSLQEMLRAASQRRRNVIIDQTNVYGNAQKRKSRPFEGFKRRAVVLVPSDDDYKARCKAQEDAGCKDIPEDAIMEMKANFALPEEDKEAVVPTFVEITFVELDREEATKRGRTRSSAGTTTEDQEATSGVPEARQALFRAVEDQCEGATSEEALHSLEGAEG